jgi:hypothetical protein
MSQMMSDPDPKFRQSKFLQFIQNINKGNFEIKENELIKHKEEPLELLGEKEGLGINHWAQKVIGDDMDVLGEMEDAFQDSEALVDSEGNKVDLLTNAYNEALVEGNMEESKMRMMDSEFGKAEAQVENEMITEKQAGDEAKLNSMETFWSTAMKNYNPEDPDMLEKLQGEWNSIIDNWDVTEDAMEKHWQVASDIEEMQFGNLKSNYGFSKQNPYANHANPHIGYLDAITKGDTPTAILMLEVHLQKHETDSQGWRLLGILLQENDQDQKSCSAL